MSRLQWILVILILGLGLLGGLVLLSLDSLTPVQSAEEGHEEAGGHAEEGEAGHDEHAAAGPHEGVLLGEPDQAVKLEVITREKGQGKLQLSFYAISEGKAIKPEELQLDIHAEVSERDFSNSSR